MGLVFKVPERDGRLNCVLSISEIWGFFDVVLVVVKINSTAIST